MKRGFPFLGLQVTQTYKTKVSEHRTRIALTTSTGNHYAVYCDTHSGSPVVYANWRRNHLEGKEKEEALTMFKRFKQ